MIQKLCAYVYNTRDMFQMVTRSLAMESTCTWSQTRCSRLACLLFSPQKRPTTAVKIQCNFPNFLPFVKKSSTCRQYVKYVCVCNLVGGGMRFRLRDFESLREETSPSTWASGWSGLYHRKVGIAKICMTQGKTNNLLIEVCSCLRLKLRLYLVVF